MAYTEIILKRSVALTSKFVSDISLLNSSTFFQHYRGVEANNESGVNY